MGLADKSVRIIAKPYEIKKHIRLDHLSPDKIKAYRAEHARPIIDDFKIFINDNELNELFKSSLGAAFHYADNQWHELIKYLGDGRLVIDDNETEQKIKPFVISRKNWMFSTSIAGIQSSEVLYSLIETCKIHKIEPYAYLRYVLTHIPSINPESDLKALLQFNVQL